MYLLFNEGSALKLPRSAEQSPATLRRLRLRALPQHWRFGFDTIGKGDFGFDIIDKGFYGRLLKYFT